MHSPARGPSDCDQAVRGALGRYNLMRQNAPCTYLLSDLSILPSGGLSHEVSAHAKAINQSTIPG